MTANLTKFQWETAHNIARELVLEKTDVNEVEKANDYLFYYAKTREQFFKYLQTLAKQGQRIGHSKKTADYYDDLFHVCRKYLQVERDSIEAIQQIMGWTSRLMRYYKEGFSEGELEELVANTEQTPIVSERQAEVAEAIASQDYQIGQIVTAKITNKKDKGKVVTYTINEIPTTQKEPKIFDKLELERVLKVKIVSLRDDGRIKKVSPILE